MFNRMGMHSLDFSYDIFAPNPIMWLLSRVLSQRPYHMGTHWLCLTEINPMSTHKLGIGANRCIFIPIFTNYPYIDLYGHMCVCMIYFLFIFCLYQIIRKQIENQNMFRRQYKYKINAIFITYIQCVVLQRPTNVHCFFKQRCYMSKPTD